MSRVPNVRVTVETATGPPALRPLRFGQGNAKLSPCVTTFSLPAGWSCPYADRCQSRANRNTGALRDGRHTAFRCYAAAMEARRPSVRNQRWFNLHALRACRSQAAMTRLILDSLSPFARLVRVHDSGDFFSQSYFDAWVAVARERPETVFYAYSKSLPSWLARLGVVGNGREPGRVSNLVLTASYGGTHDELIAEYGLRSARVVYAVDEAEELGLVIDHDDSHAMRHGGDFALLLHGQQPKGSEAAAALASLRKSGWTGYGPSRVPLPLVKS